MDFVEDDAVTAQNTDALAAFKNGQRAVWASGDFAATSERTIWDVGARIVRHLGIRRGEDVLDVACGSGNAALRAAKAGANVIGVDITPELFVRAQELAEQEGVWLELIEGDAENLPFEGASFDAVVSTFGHMFAPRHRVAATEIARVLRPGGRCGLVAWTPEGEFGRLFKILAEYTPPPPDIAEPPLLWGDEQHARAMFEDTGVELQFKRETVRPPDFDNSDDAVEFWSTKAGPLVVARAAAEGSGRWPELQARLREFFDQRAPLEYLVILGRKA